MRRIPEPELMDEAEQAQAYAEADFESAHQGFIELFQARFPNYQLQGQVLDLGCGPCDISRRFARAFPATTIHAVDGAAAMLQQAERFNHEQGLSERILLIENVLPVLQLPQAHYQTIISNSLLHHLHAPHVLWNSIKQQAEPCTRVFVMDLMRPKDEKAAHQLVEQYAAEEPEILQQDFFHSLLAAFTPEEVQQQLEESSLTQLAIETTSDRHMIIYGRL